MKKLFVVLMLAALVMHIPSDKWGQLPDKGKFITDLGNYYIGEVNPTCNKVRILWNEIGDEILFIIDCPNEEAEVRL